MMWHDMWNGAMWPWGFLMGLFWLGLFGLIIFLAVYAAQGWSARQQTPAGGPPTGPGTTEPQPDEDPREILDRRYAAGEISRDEYEQMKQDLE